MGGTKILSLADMKSVVERVDNLIPSLVRSLNMETGIKSAVTIRLEFEYINDGDSAVRVTDTVTPIYAKVKDFTIGMANSAGEVLVRNEG
jgi:hypothetical protein